MDVIDAQIDELGPKLDRLLMLRSAARKARRYLGDYSIAALSELADRISDIRVYECFTREASFFIGERHFEFFYTHLTHQTEHLEYLGPHPDGPWSGNFRDNSEMPKLADLLSGGDPSKRVLAVFLLEALAHGHSDGTIPELRAGTGIPGD